MKLHLTKAAGRNLFTGYGDGYVSVNDQRYTRPVIVAPEGEVEPWNPQSFEALTADDFDVLTARSPELVLLGTGSALRFPKPDVIRPLVTAGVGFEAMDTRAACRTYNILMAEGRQVIAAIFV
ncbi:MAG TPA: Mth938-like domain-containing protein [Burkholderiales bacterium]|nr:Mth938-like domain-containing protein [Burkholderiales bacterium]